MTDSTDQILLTRQTVDVPTDLMQHFDAIKRRRGFRSFGAYVVNLIRRDMNGADLMAPAYSQKTEESVIPEAYETLLKVMEHLETLAKRVEAKVDLLGEKIGGSRQPTATKPRANRKALSVRTGT